MKTIFTLSIIFLIGCNTSSNINQNKNSTITSKTPILKLLKSETDLTCSELELIYKLKPNLIILKVEQTLDSLDYFMGLIQTDNRLYFITRDKGLAISPVSDKSIQTDLALILKNNNPNLHAVEENYSAWGYIILTKNSYYKLSEKAITKNNKSQAIKLSKLFSKLQTSHIAGRQSYYSSQKTQVNNSALFKTAIENRTFIESNEEYNQKYIFNSRGNTSCFFTKEKYPKLSSDIFQDYYPQAFQKLLTKLSLIGFEISNNKQTAVAIDSNYHVYLILSHRNYYSIILLHDYFNGLLFMKRIKNCKAQNNPKMTRQIMNYISWIKYVVLGHAISQSEISNLK